MDRFFQALRPLIRGVVRHAWLVLALAAALTVVALMLARNLRIDTDIAELLPDDYASVQALERLRETVGTETALAVGIESPSFEANKAFAEALIPRMLALRGDGYDAPFFYRVEYRRDTEFLERNALFFATSEELDRLEAYLEERREEAILEANPFFFSLDDEEETEPDSTAEDLLASYEEIVGKEYPVSADSTVLAVHFFPTGSQTNIAFIEDIYAAAEELAAEMQPRTFHPDMKVTVGGRLFRRLAEIRAITSDVARSFGVGASTVLLLVIGYFVYKSYAARRRRRFDARLLLTEIARAPVLALLIATPLLMGLSWTFGLAYAVLDTLNLMTSTLGLVLFGLGIDFGIHFYARYTEERAEGRDVAEAAEVTFSSTGQAITAGALTTASALFVLMAADFRGFSEFGFMAGTGILFALASMLLVLPALIAVFERTGLLNLRAGGAQPSPFARRGRRFPGARGVVAASVLAVVAALVFVPRVSFEYELGTLEPTYEEYNVRQDVIGQVVGSSEGRRNPAYVVLDDEAEAPAVLAALRAKMEADTTSPTILRMESLQDRFPPSDAEKRRKLERIRAIRALLDDPALEDEDSEALDRLRTASSTDTVLSLEDIPDDLRKRFTSKQGEVGNFVIVYPSVGLSDARQSIAFSEDVGRIVTEDGSVYHAASSSLVGADMVRLMTAEAPWMVLATFLIVALLMGLNFRSVRWATLAMLPLVVGVLWMLLLMEIFSLKLNFYNLVVLPAVLGIGNDAGVHLVHRYREAGPGSIRGVLRSTGEHVTMGSLTTMVGFGGLLLSFHPGLRSIGELAVAGIGATLLAALLFLPALLQQLEDRRSGPAQD